MLFLGEEITGGSCLRGGLDRYGGVLGAHVGRVFHLGVARTDKEEGAVVSVACHGCKATHTFQPFSAN